MRLSRIISFIAGFVFAASAGAQVPSFSVVSYYESAAYLTERFIPFAVQLQTGQNVTAIKSIEISKPCYAMVDPHRAFIFHIYCSEAADISFSVIIEEEGQLFKISLPEIHIQKLAILSSIPKPKTGSGATITDPLLLGRQKFTTNCATCHPGQVTLPTNTTPSTLRSAFNNSPMTRFRGVFSPAELSALSKYINEGL